MWIAKSRSVKIELEHTYWQGLLHRMNLLGMGRTNFCSPVEMLPLVEAPWAACMCEMLLGDYSPLLNFDQTILCTRRSTKLALCSPFFFLLQLVFITFYPEALSQKFQPIFLSN